MNHSGSAVDKFMEEAVTRINHKKPESPFQLLSQVLQLKEEKKSSIPSTGRTQVVVKERGI